MVMKRTMTSIATVLLCMFVSGCSKVPPGFPKLFPITVTVTDGTEPIPKIRIVFYPKSDSGAYAISGETKSDGVAPIFTVQGEYMARGVPEGEYVVTVADNITLEHWLSPAERAALSRSETAEYITEYQKQLAEIPRCIPGVLCVMARPDAHGAVPARSPITFEVKKGKNVLDIDVSQYK